MAGSGHGGLSPGADVTISEPKGWTGGIHEYTVALRLVMSEEEGSKLQQTTTSLRL